MNAIPPPRLAPGIYSNVPEATYHADPAFTPSASAGVLKTLSQRSPLHAWYKHPRLNPAWQDSPGTEAMNAGTILHSMICGTPAPYVIGAYDDYRKNEAKDWRDDVIAQGLIPMLAHKLEPIRAVASAIRERIADMPDIAAAIEMADKEATLIAEERGVLCRCRYDILPPREFGFAVDLKFTGLSAEPEAWGRKLVNDHLFQAALYPRLAKTLRGDRPEFRFLVCETEPPYGVSLHAMDLELADLADRRLDAALSRWGACLRANAWPGYEPMTHYQAAPPWELARQEEAEFRATIGEDA
ncbi:MAG: hypothetical protein JWQ02_4244 [Capsulimonas sp.]|nr:hypothetical protein [Capsulimonas sp.]